MENQIFIGKDYGWFLGGFDNNKSHKHYAIQLSIPINGSLKIFSSGKIIETNSPILIKPNVEHQILSNVSQFLVLINPASTIGHFWNGLTSNNIVEVTTGITLELQSVLNTSKENNFSNKLNSVLRKNDCLCNDILHAEDARINKSLKYLSKNYERVILLEEIAEHCNLSPSRFLHLFKSSTGITYRRAQLWNKVLRSLPLLGKKNFTQIAFEVGFADSGHYSRVFKENFGFSPREFLKLSQFIQV